MHIEYISKGAPTVCLTVVKNYIGKISTEEISSKFMSTVKITVFVKLLEKLCNGGRSNGISRWGSGVY